MSICFCFAAGGSAQGCLPVCPLAGRLRACRSVFQFASSVCPHARTLVCPLVRVSVCPTARSASSLSAGESSGSSAQSVAGRLSCVRRGVAPPPCLFRSPEMSAAVCGIALRQMLRVRFRLPTDVARLAFGCGATRQRAAGCRRQGAASVLRQPDPGRKRHLGRLCAGADRRP